MNYFEENSEAPLTHKDLALKTGSQLRIRTQPYTESPKKLLFFVLSLRLTRGFIITPFYCRQVLEHPMG